MDRYLEVDGASQLLLTEAMLQTLLLSTLNGLIGVTPVISRLLPPVVSSF